MNPRMEAENLVKRIMSGDTVAESELVERYRRGVALMIRRKVRDPTVAEDLFQEVFFLAIQKIRGGEVRQPGKLNSYLFGLTNNLVIGHFRRESKHALPGKYADRKEFDPVAVPHSPFEDLLRDERAHVTRQTLTELKSDRDRDLLFRFFIAEEEKAEICRDLGLTAIHFNRVLYRAKKRYKRLLLKKQPFNE